MALSSREFIKLSAYGGRADEVQLHGIKRGRFHGDASLSHNSIFHRPGIFHPLGSVQNFQADDIAILIVVDDDARLIFISLSSMGALLNRMRNTSTSGSYVTFMAVSNTC